MQDMRFKIGAVTYRLRPDMPLLLQIEDELGALPQLAARFRGRDWSFADLVSLHHMLLQHAGRPMDYMALGNLLLGMGMTACHATVLRFFDLLCLPPAE